MITLVTNNRSLDSQEYLEYNKDYYINKGVIYNGKMVRGEEVLTRRIDEWTKWYSKNHDFNDRIYGLNKNKPLRILDLGCGAGFFIEDCINDQHIGIGVDGNQFYKEKSVPWINNSNNFFLCDIGKNFFILEDGHIMTFDFITSWECMEHLYEKDINTFMKNVSFHSRPGTHFIFSVSTRLDPPGHQCIHEKEWWFEKAYSVGFKNLDLDFKNDLIRCEPDSFIGYMVKK